jgi:competence protein ComEC
MMGDVDANAEDTILTSGVDVSAHVIKIGHHGSCGSTSPLLIQAAQPTAAVVSVGENNGYGHPYLAVLERLPRAEGVGSGWTLGLPSSAHLPWIGLRGSGQQN